MMHTGKLVVVGAVAAWVFGCFGSGGSDGAGGDGVTAGVGASGTSGIAGTGSGGTGVVTGTGGTSGGGCGLCSVPACRPGETPEQGPGDCCPSCGVVGTAGAGGSGGAGGTAGDCPTVECDGTPFEFDANGCRVCSEANACDAVATCVPNTDCGGVACCDELGNYFDCECGNVNCALSLHCPDGTGYGCAPPTQGEQPPVPPQEVCGCMPDCPNGQFLIANAASGTWPDGSPRGTFTCSVGLPP